MNRKPLFALLLSAGCSVHTGSTQTEPQATSTATAPNTKEVKTPFAHYRITDVKRYEECEEEMQKARDEQEAIEKQERALGVQGPPPGSPPPGVQETEERKQRRREYAEETKKRIVLTDQSAEVSKRLDYWRAEQKKCIQLLDE